MRNCAKLWQRSLASIFGGLSQAETARWAVRQWHFDLTCFSLCWLCIGGQCLHLCKLDAGTGHFIASLSFPLSSIDGINEVFAIHQSQMAFSSDGQRLAASVSVKEEGEDTRAMVIVVLNVETFQVHMWTVSLVISYDEWSIGSTPVWSANDAMLAASRRLMHLQNEAVQSLGNSDEALFRATAFNRTGTCLACVQLAVGGVTRQITSFVDPADGAELFRVSNKGFIAFLTARRCVLKPEPGSNTVRCEVWDIGQKLCLQAVESRSLDWYGAPQLVLDSYLLGKGWMKRTGSHNGDHGSALVVYSLDAGTAQAFAESLHQFCASPDECTIVSYCSTNASLSLMKLC